MFEKKNVKEVETNTHEKSVIIVLKTNNGFVAKFEDKELENFIGEGVDGSKAVANLFLNMKISLEQDEDKQIKIWMEERLPVAQKIASEMFLKVGGDPIKFSSIVSKMEEDEDLVEHKLSFIKEFGFATCDNTLGRGRKWKINPDKESLALHYKSQAEKFESTAKYYRELEKQVKLINE